MQHESVSKYLIITMFTASVIFIISGCVTFAPYWIFDGISFLISGSLATRAVLKSSSNATFATIVVAAISIPIELGFLIAAIILFDKQMNPFSTMSYGEKGNSFIICSITSASINTFAVIHFRKVYRGLHSSQEDDPMLPVSEDKAKGSNSINKK